MRIGLVADIPDELGARRVEDVVQRDGELDHAEARPEMPAGARHGVDGLAAHLAGELLELIDGERAHVLGRATAVEDGG